MSPHPEFLRSKSAGQRTESRASGAPQERRLEGDFPSPALLQADTVEHVLPSGGLFQNLSENSSLGSALRGGWEGLEAED